MTAKRFNTPFAIQGDKVEVPSSAQVDGSVSYEQGYPFGYELDYTDPNTKDISRSKTNQLLYDITNAIREIQQGGVSEWSEEGKPYKINSLVYAPDGTIKQSLIANNNNDTTHSTWSNLINASTLATILANVSALPIGTILNGYTIFDNCIVAFGGEFNRADYPKLWAYLQGKAFLKTESQWQTEATANGGICGFFSDGNGTTTFRVPNLDKAFLRPDSRGVGSYQGDAIRNIEGTISGGSASYFWNNSPIATGAFDTNGTETGPYSSSGSTGSTKKTLFFKASNVVPTSTENRPKNIAVLPLIVAK